MDILFVIVLYKSRLFDTATYKTLISKNPQLKLFVYDNSPAPMHYCDEFTKDNIIYISDTQNSGLSVAYNRAAEYAVSNNIDWVLLSDQDTLFADNILNNYCNAAKENPQIKLFIPPMQIANGSYMSPVRSFLHITKPSRNYPQGIISLKRYAPINSGMLINTEAFWKVGGYNEAVFLDYSDYQFIERFRRIYSQAYVIKSVCNQSFSNDIEDSQSKLTRFGLFCRSLRECDRDTFIDSIGYSIIIFKRTLSLIISTRSIDPIKILIRNYLRP